MWRFMAGNYYGHEQDASSSRRQLLKEAKRYLEDFLKPAMKLYAKEYPRVLMLLGEPTDVVEKAFDEITNSRLEQAEGTLLAHHGRFYEVIGRTEKAIAFYQKAIDKSDYRVPDVQLARRGLKRLKNCQDVTCL